MDVEGELRAVEEGTTEVMITSMCLVFRYNFMVITCNMHKYKQYMGTGYTCIHLRVYSGTSE